MTPTSRKVALFRVVETPRWEITITTRRSIPNTTIFQQLPTNYIRGTNTSMITGRINNISVEQITDGMGEGLKDGRQRSVRFQILQSSRFKQVQVRDLISYRGIRCDSRVIHKETITT